MLGVLRRAFAFRPLPKPLTRSKIVKFDTVHVTAGKDKGKQGRVLQVDLKHNQVLVDGVNLVSFN